MYSDNRSIQQLAALLPAHGITDVVVCPGSRNAPIVHTLTQMSNLRCHRLTDERSAGFFAIGLAQSQHRPTAVCVTSGSALLNLHPAVAEAYYQRVPLVIISADRPNAWIGQMDGQTLPQPHALGDMVRRSVQLPEIHTDEDLWYANRLINEALLDAIHYEGAPVHINVPIAEPFYGFHTQMLPSVRVIHRTIPNNTLSDQYAAAQRPMIIIGQQHETLSVPKGCVVLSEHLGNQSCTSRNIDALIDGIEGKQNEDYTPDLVITIGGHIVSKELKNFLRKQHKTQHWHVSPRGEIADLFRCLTTVVECDGENFLKFLPERLESPFTSLWKCLNEVKVETSAEALCIGNLISHLPAGSALHLANSSAVRLAQQFPLRPDISVWCNRGVNGIEGSLSTAVGYATAKSGQPTFIIIGDLSFFYDQNALWNTSLPQNLHILLLNNGGGRIFESLPLPDDAESRHSICGTHNINAKSVAQTFGLQYLHGEEQLAAFIATRQAVILEITTPKTYPI